MLTGVNQDVLNRYRRPLIRRVRVDRTPLVVLVDGRDDRRGLHKVRSRADDGNNLHMSLGIRIVLFKKRPGHHCLTKSSRVPESRSDSILHSLVYFTLPPSILA